MTLQSNFRVSLPLALLLLVGGMLMWAGLRVNTTTSTPLGFYWEIKRPAIYGDYVMFCPPQTEPFSLARQRGYIDIGSCPGKYGRLIKKILAAKGQSISINQGGVFVDGHMLAHSAARTLDREGRPLPVMNLTDYVLKQNEVLLMSESSDTSYDGRYFGVVSAAQIEGVLVPLITW